MSLSEFAAPVAVVELDLADPLSDVRLGNSERGAPYTGALFVARHGAAPLGTFALDAVGGEIAAARIAAALDELGIGPVKPSATANEPRTANDDPLVSVVICTVNDGESADRAIEAILSGSHQNVEVIVVNNRPKTADVESRLAQRYPDELRVRSVSEARPGLAYARNAGIVAARGELFVFTDDDVLPDRRWLEQIVLTFSGDPSTACVTGLILPHKFETDAQLLLERFAGFSKGFEEKSYLLSENLDDPLFPYAAGKFGSGANIAIARWASDDLGGYDVALGTGTPAKGGEDLDLFIRVLLRGHRLTYQPAAIVWHEHPETMPNLVREVRDYGTGLAVVIAKQLWRGPQRMRLISKLVRGVIYGLNPKSEKNARKGDAYPLRFTIGEIRGVLYGPIAYFRSRRAVARYGRADR